MSIVLFAFTITVFAQEIEYETKFDIQYYADSINQGDKYISERCVLDLYYPKK